MSTNNVCKVMIKFLFDVSSVGNFKDSLMKTFIIGMGVGDGKIFILLVFGISTTNGTRVT